MDRDRYRKRASDLHGCAQIVQGLTKMPDRATEKDFRQAADLMTDAANDILELIKAKPSGCTCRRIQDDNYDYLDYAEGCLHHSHLYQLRENLKGSYEKMERALKDEVRLRIITAALSGTAASHDDDDVLVRRAINVADEALRKIAAEVEQ